MTAILGTGIIDWATVVDEAEGSGRGEIGDDDVDWCSDLDEDDGDDDGEDDTGWDGGCVEEEEEVEGVGSGSDGVADKGVSCLSIEVDNRLLAETRGD